MAAYFFDSSALAKLYYPEIGTPKVDLMVQATDSEIRISRLPVPDALGSAAGRWLGRAADGAVAYNR